MDLLRRFWAFVANALSPQPVRMPEGPLPLPWTVPAENIIVLGPRNLEGEEPLVDRITGMEYSYVGPYGTGGVHIEVRDGNGMLRHVLRAGVKRPPKVA